MNELSTADILLGGDSQNTLSSSSTTGIDDALKATTNSMFDATPQNRNNGKDSEELPEWLDSLKGELLSTGEWGALVRDVYNGITGRLAQNHIQFFSDLLPSEKSLFIDEVEKSLFSTPTYKKFQGMLSRSLDHSLSEAVSGDILSDLGREDLLPEQGQQRSALLGVNSDLEEKKKLDIQKKKSNRASEIRSNRAKNGTGHRVDQILERASEGAVKLLQRLPSEKSSLRIMLNNEFPPKLRYQAWRLYLGHPKAREKYEKAIIVSRMSTISDQDATIALQCQAILDQQIFQQDMMVRVPNPHTVLVNMKT
jgi:hypothetical protein